MHKEKTNDKTLEEKQQPALIEYTAEQGLTIAALCAVVGIVRTQFQLTRLR